MRDQSTQNHCPELWQRIYLHQVNEQFLAKPCCYAHSYEGNKVWIDDARRVFDIYNQSPKIQHLRDENMQGRLGEGCRVCLHAEQAVGSSGRTRAIERNHDQAGRKLTAHIDLNLGNLCNLACAICDPHSSTSWVPIYQRMQGQPWTHTTYIKHNRPVIDDPELFANIETLQLQGGEVFMQSAYSEFFRNLARVRDLSGISVIIFSNGTVTPDPDLWTYLNQCGQVELFFSIDDMGYRFEYQRHGANWVQVIENIRWFQNHAGANFTLGFHPTYSLLNIYYLRELQQFMADQFPGFQRNWGPYHVDSGPCIGDHLPQAVRQAVLEKNAGITELAFLGDYIRERDRDFTDFHDYIRRYDQATRKSYQQTHKEFYNLLTS